MLLMGCIKFWLFFVAPPIVLLLVLIAARGRKGKATRKRERERERAQMRWIEDSKAFRVTPAETKVDSLLRAPSGLATMNIASFAATASKEIDMCRISEKTSVFAKKSRCLWSQDSFEHTLLF